MRVFGSLSIYFTPQLETKYNIILDYPIVKCIFQIMQNNINDKEIADWVNECPTHKIEVLYSDENGIQLLVNFNNEKEENND